MGCAPWILGACALALHSLLAGLQHLKGGAGSPLPEVSSYNGAFGAVSDPAFGYNVRVDATAAATGGVPEPATLALMISGFGLAGASLRDAGLRRRSRTWTT